MPPLVPPMEPRTRAICSRNSEGECKARESRAAMTAANYGHFENCVPCPREHVVPFAPYAIVDPQSPSPEPASSRLSSASRLTISLQSDPRTRYKQTSQLHIIIRIQTLIFLSSFTFTDCAIPLSAFAATDLEITSLCSDGRL